MLLSIPGYSNGLVPMLRNFNETARYVDQGGGVGQNGVIPTLLKRSWELLARVIVIKVAMRIIP